MRKGWLFGLAMLAALALAILATTPPGAEIGPVAARSADTPSGRLTDGLNGTTFDTGLAMLHVERLAGEPRPTGSAANARARAYLAKELEALGLEVRTMSGTLDAAGRRRLAGWSGGDPDAAVTITNVVGRLPGRDPDLPAVALMAHHDSVWGSPGAADDAAGVAAILETVRALTATGQVERDVLVIFTDAEELGLGGARLFFGGEGGANPLAERIGAIVNLEARGGGGIANLFQLSPRNEGAARLYAESVQRPAISSLSAYIYSVLPNDTDLTVPLERGGYLAYNIAFIGRPGLYHSPLATPGNLDRGSLRHMGEQVLALTRALADAPRLPEADKDAVFFDVFGLFVIVYPPELGWGMLILAALSLAVASWRSTSTEGFVLTGVLRMTGFMFATALLLAGLTFLAGTGQEGGYYDALGAIARLMAMALAAVLGMALAWFGRAPTASLARTRIGAALPLLLLAVLGQYLAPTAAYPLVVPVLLVALVEAVGCLSGRTTGRVAGLLAMVLVSGYLLAIGYMLMQAVGASLAIMAAVPAGFAVSTWLVLWPGMQRARAWAGALLLASVAIALWVRFDAVPPSVAVYSPLRPD